MNIIEEHVRTIPDHDEHHLPYKQLKRLKEFILNSSAINTTKIAFLKKELTTDCYKVHSEEIAQQLFSEVEMA